MTESKYDWNKIIPLYLEARKNNHVLSINTFCKDKEYSTSALRDALKKQGIVIESLAGKGGGVKIDESKHRDSCIFRFDGTILGDGSIVFTHKTKNKFPSLSIASKYKEYLEWLQNSPLFLNRPIWSTDYKDKRTGNIYTGWWMKSSSSSFLLEQRNRWYPSGKKTLPYDININKQTLLHFYLDDGSLSSSGGLTLATNDFSFEEAETLKFKLSSFTNLNFNVHNNQGTPRLYIPKHQAADFLNIIGPCPVTCFEYKWNLK